MNDKDVTPGEWVALIIIYGGIGVMLAWALLDELSR